MWNRTRKFHIPERAFLLIRGFSERRVDSLKPQTQSLRFDWDLCCSCWSFETIEGHASVLTDSVSTSTHRWSLRCRFRLHLLCRVKHTDLFCQYIYTNRFFRCIFHYIWIFRGNNRCAYHTRVSPNVHDYSVEMYGLILSVHSSSCPSVW